MAGARRRVLGPGHAGLQPCHPAAQRLLGLVEDRELVGPRLVVLDITVGAEDRDGLARSGIAVAARPHPVADIVGEQVEPFAKAALVQEARLAVEELLDLAERIIVTHALSPAPRRSPARSSLPPPSPRPSAHKTAGGCSR